MCSLNSCFHGAGGSEEAVGVVLDMVRRTRERRLDAIREAMVAVLAGRLQVQFEIQVYVARDEINDVVIN
jgi:HAMP domain-containing protein